MDPKERELRQKLAKLLGEARSLAEEGKLTEATAIKDQAAEIRKQIDTLVEIRDLTPEAQTIPAAPEQREKDSSLEYRTVFFKALRNKSLTQEERDLLEEKMTEIRAMSGKTDEDGGLVIPDDVQTTINELSRSFDALEQYVTVETVRSRSGSRVLEKNAEMVPFAEVDEMGDIPEEDSPKFSKLDYAIKDRSGILPLSRTLLQDSDQAILDYVTRWLGKKSKITRNKLILDQLKTLSKKTIATFDDIKDILNVTLDPAIAATSIVLTNQDGFNFLDKLKDSDGKYILTPDVTQPKRKVLDGSIPVVVVANRFLKTAGTTEKKAPVIIGDLKEAIVLFKRNEMEVASTEVGGDAFKRNTLDVRAIQRDDVKTWDADAAVYAEITLP